MAEILHCTHTEIAGWDTEQGSVLSHVFAKQTVTHTKWVFALEKKYRFSFEKWKKKKTVQGKSKN